MVCTAQAGPDPGTAITDIADTRVARYNNVILNVAAGSSHFANADVGVTFIKNVADAAVCRFIVEHRFVRRTQPSEQAFEFSFER